MKGVVHNLRASPRANTLFNKTWAEPYAFTGHFIGMYFDEGSNQSYIVGQIPREAKPVYNDQIYTILKGSDGSRLDVEAVRYSYFHFYCDYYLMSVHRNSMDRLRIIWGHTSGANIRQKKTHNTLIDRKEAIKSKDVFPTMSSKKWTLKARDRTIWSSTSSPEFQMIRKFWFRCRFLSWFCHHFSIICT